VREEPELAWRLILAILRLDAYGEAFIDAVEREARSDPAFVRLLGGVWQNSMSASIWARVQRVWDRRGWDSVPEE